MAEKNNCQVISINTFWEDVLKRTDHYYWNCMPEEFLYLINNAEAVVTNSFHGLSFSMIFNKPVILFEKNDSGNSRMRDLLKTLEIEELITKQDKNYTIPNLPYKMINERIKAKQADSKAFLSRFLPD